VVTALRSGLARSAAVFTLLPNRFAFAAKRVKVRRKGAMAEAAAFGAEELGRAASARCAQAGAMTAGRAPARDLGL